LSRLSRRSWCQEAIADVEKVDENEFQAFTTLFNQVFGTPAVTSARISLALAQFVRSIISTQTKYDAGVPLNFSNFTPQENQGAQIFGGMPIKGLSGMALS
jgi:cytochrome c peroxidase